METAYRPGIESGRGDDDDEEAGGADKKQEGAYHRLDETGHGAFEELWQRKREEHQSVFGKLFEKPESDGEDDEDDEDDEEENGKRKKRKKKKQDGQAHYTSGADTAQQHQAEAPVKPSEQSERGSEADATQSTSQAIPHQRQGEDKPAWQKEDDAAFQDIMEREMPELKDAASGDLLKDTKSGEPPAVERTTNEAVSLEPEPTQTVEGYRTAEPEQRYQGYTPGHNYVSEAQPSSPTRFEGADQPPVTGAAPPKPFDRVPGPNVSTRTAERGRSLRDTMVAATVMTIAVAGYFANRRRKAENRAQQKTINKQHGQIKQQKQDIDRFAAGQENMRQRLADQEAHAAATQQHTAREFAQQRAAFEHAQNQPLQAPERTVPQPSPEAAARAAGMAPRATEAAREAQSMEDAQEAARRAVEEARQAAAAAQEPQRRVEQDAWRRYVVDEQGHEVQNVIQYGQEYTHERQQELRDNRQSAGPVRVKSQQPQYDRDTGSTMLGGAPHLAQPSSAAKASGAQQPHKAIDSGLTPGDHSLPAGMPTPADWQHRLPEKKRNQVLAALTSPWLFLMLSLILLAYFIASLL